MERKAKIAMSSCSIVLNLLIIENKKGRIEIRPGSESIVFILLYYSFSFFKLIVLLMVKPKAK